MTKSKYHLPHPFLLALGILLIAANLRAPIVGVTPLFEMVREAFDLDTFSVGSLTTLPLLAFAFISPFCVLLAREYGLERSLFIALILIAIGVIARLIGPAWMLFVGSAVIGFGIAIGNVLLPALIKRDFPDRIASMTSAYALTMNATTALTAMAVVPIALRADLRWALGAFVILPVIAMIIWVPQLTQRSKPTAETATPPHGGKIWRSPLAWQVSLFFGLNSIVAYTIMTWLPAILTDAGYSPEAAGSYHGISQLTTAAPSLVLASMIRRFRDQRGIAVVASTLAALSVAGLLLVPGFALLWIILFGFGAGTTFILALSFVGLRAANARQAGALSAMAQTIGYTIAAIGPPLMGLLHDISGGWLVPLSLTVALCAVMAGFGYTAGRSRLIP